MNGVKQIKLGEKIENLFKVVFFYTNDVSGDKNKPQSTALRNKIP